ncbi:hypothetical protein Smp_182890 [Schistosoma mansoni]|uniref:ATP-binding protein n=1 Tax=Schistosoma mansoni TaxID=6183 RepID=C1M1E5_SCHMA|nr:hypothetical protein Smp_182890 [Schistosoma mansoni]|eukprot:XP_018644050.1 hypothetical protein Smp_182890 [Schistosoma mansoni]
MNVLVSAGWRWDEELSNQPGLLVGDHLHWVWPVRE